MKRTLLVVIALCFFTLVYAISTGVLLPTGDGTLMNFTDFAGGTTALWDEINEDPDSSPNDSDGVQGADNTQTDGMFDMANMPGDFVTMISLDLEVRCALRDSPPVGPDNWSARLQIFESNESTELSDMASDISITDDQTFRNYTATLTNVTPGDKTVWDGAKIYLIHVYSQFKGTDENTMRCSAMKMSGTYTVASTGQLRGATLSGVKISKLLREYWEKSNQLRAAHGSN